MASKPPLVAIVGPTAVGKTEHAIAVAEKLNAEIVSADSRLFYRGMDIGTAKPTAAQRARVPHHLIDIADPNQPISLPVFQQLAAEAIASIHTQGKLPILVGGTGQYVRAILEGWSPPKLAPQPRLRDAISAWGNEIGGVELHRRLAVLDPQAASIIDARNVRRTQRALEVILATGRRFSAQRNKSESLYHALLIGLTLPRSELYARIDQRIASMLANGWLQEVQGLLNLGYDPSLPAMSAIGYAQLARHLRGELSLEEAVTEIKRGTRAFVRRQGAWFPPSDPGIRWFENKPGVEAAIQNEIAGFLKQQ
jgi:tRNA dimethylallyltransferase